jgi:hypothetical protein
MKIQNLTDNSMYCRIVYSTNRIDWLECCTVAATGGRGDFRHHPIGAQRLARRKRAVSATGITGDS